MTLLIGGSACWHECIGPLHDRGEILKHPILQRNSWAADADNSTSEQQPTS